MKKNILILILIIFSSCYFGANEYSGKITRDFYLTAWDQQFYQVSRSKNNDVFNSENVIITNEVFGVGNNDDFIIVAQHPSKRFESFIGDLENEYVVNKEITNYFIIELLDNNNFKIHKYTSKSEYLNGRIKLGVPEDLEYKFYNEVLE